MTGSIVAVLVLMLAWGAGSYRLALLVPDRVIPVRIRLVQPNAPQRDKWNPALAPMFFKRALDLTAAATERHPNLVIWPEAAVLFLLDEAPEQQQKIAEAAPPGARVIIGARRREGTRFYNSMALLDEQGKAARIYDKSHLVPFGEYMPFGSLLARLGIYGLAAEDGGGFSAGKGTALLDLDEMGKVRPLICYEAIFPHLSNSGDRRPDWILQITNDAWFGTLAGPQQHLAQTRLRAIEQGVPLVRVANTGISAVINAKGQIVAWLPLETAGRLDADLPGVLPETFYRKTGDWLVLLLLLMGLGCMGLARSRNK